MQRHIAEHLTAAQATNLECDLTDLMLAYRPQLFERSSGHHLHQAHNRQLLNRARADSASVAEHCDAVSDFENLLQAMGDVDDRSAVRLERRQHAKQ